MALLCFWSALAARGDEPLRAEVIPAGLRLRSNAPASIEVRLHWQGSGLPEGSLEISLLDLGEPIIRHRTQPLILTTGAQTYRFLIPPAARSFSARECEAGLRFITKNRTFQLGKFPLPAPGVLERSFVIAVGRDAATGEQTRRNQLWQSLRLERFAPSAKKGPGFPLFTSPAYLAPEDFPADPIAYCAYDIVLLDADTFSRLREKQLAALSRWVGGGGSVSVVTGESLTDAQERFLAELESDEDRVDAAGKKPAPEAVAAASCRSSAASERPEAAATAPARERLEAAATPPSQVKPDVPALRHFGLGRAVVVAGEAAEARDYDSPAWRRMAAFLWKMREDEMESCADDGVWTEGFDPARRLAEEGGLRRREIGAFQERILALLPTTYRPLPVWIIGGVLGLFLLIIGPVDYFLLGWLRRRRWTWGIFPCVCMAFTVLMLKLANHFMGLNDRRVTVMITDVGRGGRVLKSTSVELLLPARERETVVEMRRALGVPMAPYGGGGGDRTERVAVSEGQVPEHYGLHRSLLQWTPSAYRVTSFDPLAADPGIAWDAFDPALFHFRPNDFEPEVPAVAALENTKRMRGSSAFEFLYFHYATQAVPGPNAKRAPRFQNGSAFPLPVAAFCTLGADALSTILSQRSPNGSNTLEDLALEDASDPHRWMVLAWKRKGDELLIFRRLYFTRE